jgi:hypothetical protein
MIDPEKLLSGAKQLLRTLEDDLRGRATEREEIDAHLKEEFRAAKAADRTAQSFEEWREERLTQVAVAWILGCVFVRFLEDNGLVDTPRLSGSGPRLKLARDHHTLYFQSHPTETDREYLLEVFRHVKSLPAAGALFDEKHNPLWEFGPSGDGAAELLAFWQAIDPATGALVHDFTDPDWSTRFLGDLYQDLSEAARKKYALLQTPEFVEEFILDRTLTPAINEFEFQKVRLIDPACGSGHFLLGAFQRLFDLWIRNEPGVNARELAQRALSAVHGVDLNPFAAAIARFRLLVAALKASGTMRLADAPAFSVSVAVGDSLLHGPRPGTRSEDRQLFLLGDDPVGHLYETEDADELRRILGQRYHAVVANPPYITVKDAGLSALYRARFATCHRQYSLVVPFMERLLDLCEQPGNGGVSAGFLGAIVSNAFMKREFGTKLIEEFLPKWDLTHVLNTSGAYLPGHGTPTVILFARGRKPVDDTVRAVMSIRGEPKAPDNPAEGLVWTEIVRLVDTRGAQGDFVSVSDIERGRLAKHPWSMGGGGAAELRELIESGDPATLRSLRCDIGFLVITGEDNCLILDDATSRRLQVASLPIGLGDDVRDWTAIIAQSVLWPYASDGQETLSEDALARHKRFLWAFRRRLQGRKAFGVPVEAKGIPWWGLREIYSNRLRIPLSIAFAFVATHNHFVLDRGGKVFNRSAPVIQLPTKATVDDYLRLLGLLNSSTSCFWMKQVLYPKGGSGIGRGVQDEDWESRFEHDGTKLEEFPVPEWGQPALTLSRLLDSLGQRLSTLLRAALAAATTLTRQSLDVARMEADSTRRRMIGLQEELDWQVYKLYDLFDEVLALSPDDIPEIDLGERAFEIVMARKIASGELSTTWFERHGSKPIVDIPTRWAEPYRLLVAKRIEAIESNPAVALIEKPEYKRRWNTESWEDQEDRALRGWLLDRLETDRYWSGAMPTSCARLADFARGDPEFMRVAEVYRSRADFDLTGLVKELVQSESVPFLPVLRYKDTGLRKRIVWERTWDLQREEDAIDARAELPKNDPRHLGEEDAIILKATGVGDIPVPPKYASTDFQGATYWRLRGKLDVPKERFISYPHCERDADPTPVVGWAGWDHAQQARALASYYVAMKESEGWNAERLIPLLAGLLELLPWLKQWHNALDPAFAMRLGDYYEGFVEEETRSLSVTVDAVKLWSPGGNERKRKPRSS